MNTKPDMNDKSRVIANAMSRKFQRQGDPFLSYDDLLQEAYFVYLNCLKKDDPTKGSFDALFSVSLRNHFLNLSKKRNRDFEVLQYETEGEDERAGFSLSEVGDGGGWQDQMDQNLFQKEVLGRLEGVAYKVAESFMTPSSDFSYKAVTETTVGRHLGLTKRTVRFVLYGKIRKVVETMA